MGFFARTTFVLIPIQYMDVHKICANYNLSYLGAHRSTCSPITSGEEEEKGKENKIYDKGH